MRRVNVLSVSFLMSMVVIVSTISVFTSTNNMILQVRADDDHDDDSVNNGGPGDTDDFVGPEDMDNNGDRQQQPGQGQDAVVVAVKDDIWHCNPADGAVSQQQQQQQQQPGGPFVVSSSYFDLECDSTTFAWNIQKMRTDYGSFDSNPDTSDLCDEVVTVLQESVDADLSDQALIDLVNELVTDALEPCVLWEMLFGRLTGLTGIVPNTTATATATTTTNTTNIITGSNNGGGGAIEAEDPLGVDFNTIQLHLVWDGTLEDTSSKSSSSSSSTTVGTTPFSIDRTELHKVTGQHIVEALRAYLGQDMIANLDLTLQTGLPTTVQSTLLLPVTISGQVLFRDASDVVGSTSLTRIIVGEVFEKPSALDLYMFRLRIAEDVVLTKVSTVLVGDDRAKSYVANLQQQAQQQSSGNNGSSSDTDAFSLALVVIIAAVSAAFVAVVFFAYCLLCRGERSNDKSASPVIENDDYDGSHNDDKAGLINKGWGSQRPSSFLRSPRLSRGRVDEIPAVNTSETAPDIEEGVENNHNYHELTTDGGDMSVGVSQLDDGVSEIDMDTLPPPVPDADYEEDDATMDGLMSVDYNGDLVETEQYETDTYNPDEVSLAGASLYSYNQDDYSLVAPPSIAPSSYTKDYAQSMASTDTSADLPGRVDSGPSTKTASGPMEKAKKKGLLWSVMDGLKNSSDGPTTQKEPYATSMLGPTDNDSAGGSHDSNSLLYLKEAQQAGAVPRVLHFDAADTETITTIGETPTNAFYGSGKYSDKKKKQFEKLWKDEDEAEQAAAVEAHLAASAAATVKIDSTDVVTPTKETGKPSKEPPATEKRRNTAPVVVDDDDVEDYSGSRERPQESSDAQEQASEKNTLTSDLSVEATEFMNESSPVESFKAEGKGVQDAEEVEGGFKAEVAGTQSEIVTESPSDLAATADLALATTLVDRVPGADGDDEEADSNRLPLPTTLQSNLAEAKSDVSDNGSVSSSHSGSSSASSSSRRGESARKKRPSNWGSNRSVSSTDSAKFRALLSQSDTNDAAVVFRGQLEHQHEQVQQLQQQIGSIKPANNESNYAVIKSDAQSSPSASGQLKSLLLEPTESTDSAENDYENGEDFLRTVEKEVATATSAQQDVGLEATLKTGNRIAYVTNIRKEDSDSDDDDAVVRSQNIMRKPVKKEEEKKEELVDEDEDDGRRKASYLPAAIRPSESFESKSSADGTVMSVMSAISTAPSVDETVTSQMGWF